MVLRRFYLQENAKGMTKLLLLVWFLRLGPKQGRRAAPNPRPKKGRKLKEEFDDEEADVPLEDFDLAGP
jgi:hypothetical protein